MIQSGLDPGIERAKDPLANFSQFWQIATEPAERRRLLVSLSEQVRAQDGRIVAVQPHEDFLPYFQAASRCRKQGKRAGCQKRERRGLNPRCTHPSEQPAIAVWARAAGPSMSSRWTCTKPSVLLGACPRPNSRLS